MMRIVAVVVLTVCAATSPSPGVGAREPLTFKSTGLYGVWNDYFVSADSPFDFLIIQALVYKDHIGWSSPDKVDTATWNQWLKRARANGKRVIADVCPSVVDDKGKEQTLASAYDEKDPLPVERFEERFDKFFREVNADELYAITISEENVFWNGQNERLNATYGYIKKHSSVPVYQWYTPSHAGSIPGLNYPNLKADGWIADEYWLGQPAIETALRGYRIRQKPVIQIVWAVPDYPGIPWSEKTFWEQHEACRKYDVPAAFFFWVGGGKGPISTAGWDPTATAKMRTIFEDCCLRAGTLAKAGTAVPLEQWDQPASVAGPIGLKAPEGGMGPAIYKEVFTKERGLSVLADAQITGFANLRWDSGCLELRPVKPGTAEATIRYSFEVPRPLGRFVVKVKGTTTGGGMIDLCLLDANGKTLQHAELKDREAAIEFDSSGRTDSVYVVVCRMNGAREKPGQVLAELAEISVAAEPSVP